MFIAKLEAKAYSRVTEVSERVRTAILNIFPEDIRKRVRIKEGRTESHHGQPIVVLSAVLKHEKTCKATFPYILERLTKHDRMKLQRTLDLRVDEQCKFYVRFDKQAAFLEKISLYDGPDPISMSIHFRQYPKCGQEDTIEYILNCLKESEM